MITTTPVWPQREIDEAISFAGRSHAPLWDMCRRMHREDNRTFLCTRAYGHDGPHECIRPETAENSAICLARWE